MTRCFIIPGEPQGKGRAKVVRRENMPYPVAITPEKTVMYENLIKAMYMERYAGEPLMEGPLRMDVVARYTIPASVAKGNKKKARMMLEGGIRPTKKPDIDNLLKAICDAGNGVIFRDDTQIVNLHAFKLYGTTPGVAVRISTIDPSEEGIPFSDIGWEEEA